ncbi:Magnesium chelatase [Desulfarculus baarsii DSM 2075]|uniref:Mg-protoporphyrin IX chelatase n=1 Tax=Desulfarculus baarsii (strain ATCC 33931 / DSM 2075 / LMG 7858 / VKM B-1802 / 2st14) TaxID=644282 RepID=E1QGS4_DESB2|nr:VWA domain-containing protein [Desulfarculus baarsii]ADK84767.1 Magnesium chelatase [Desulfarculus baarsii DSM 2075]
MAKHATSPSGPIGYPFAAIVGQRSMKLALLLAAVDPGLGGVLLRGEKGTAKSTAARALAGLLPPLCVVAGCPLGCDPDGPPCPRCAAASRPLPRATAATPFVDLPLGATEDRLVGALDINAAIQEGRLAFAPGLLARAHRGVLYIDEVNLLAPHLAHLILDAAASGLATVEREGVSFAHPAQITLIASYNPEEGGLGPQLLDRFGLCVEVAAEQDPEARKELLRRRLAHEADPAAFAARWAKAEDRLRGRLLAARQALANVSLTPSAARRAAALAAWAGARGQRAELAMARAARALAAWQGRGQATPADVDRVAAMALAHRATGAAQNHGQSFERLLKDPPPDQPGEEEPRRVVVIKADDQLQPLGDQPGPQERVLQLWEAAEAPAIATRLSAKETGSLRQAGRRAARQTDSARGRYVRASALRLGRGLAFDATLRAAAPHQRSRRAPGGPALVVRGQDIREKVRLARRGRLIMFCVDASGSMNAAARMRVSKQAVLGLLTEAYQKRDRVGLVAFGGNAARLLLPPTGSVEVARKLLAELPTGGKTPLAAGLAVTAQAVSRELARDPKLTPLVVVFTDGRPNVPLAASLGEDIDLGRAGNKGGGWGDGWGDGGYADREALDLAKSLAKDGRVRYVVVDIDTGHFHEANLCRPLADYLGAPCISLRRLTADRVLDLVKAHW